MKPSDVYVDSQGSTEAGGRIVRCAHRPIAYLPSDQACSSAYPNIVHNRNNASQGKAHCRPVRQPAGPYVPLRARGFGGFVKSHLNFAKDVLQPTVKRSVIECLIQISH